MPNTPYTTTYDPAKHDGAVVTWRDPDGIWHTAAAHNRYLRPDAGSQIVVLEEAPEPDWPTADAILIRRGYDSSRGEVRNVTAYRIGNGTYEGWSDGRFYSFYPDIADDRIDEYVPLAVVPKDSLDTLLRDYDDGNHWHADAEHFLEAIREFQSLTNDR